jgi:hypothetical protein
MKLTNQTTRINYSCVRAQFGILLTETRQTLPATPPQEMMLVGLAGGEKRLCTLKWQMHIALMFVAHWLLGTGSPDHVFEILSN